MARCGTPSRMGYTPSHSHVAVHISSLLRTASYSWRSGLADITLVWATSLSIMALEERVDVARSWEAALFCEDDDRPADKDAAAFPTSTCSTYLQTLVYFPNCVDDSSLEISYQSESYGTDVWSPFAIKKMPQLRFSMLYEVNSVLSDGWSGDAPLILG